MTPKMYLASLLVLFSTIPGLCQRDIHMDTIASPDTISDRETNVTTVKCNMRGNTVDVHLPFIKINFKKPSSTLRELAQVVGQSASITDSNLRSRATVTGRIYNAATTSSYLFLDIWNVSCLEVGNYTCVTECTDVNGTHRVADEVMVDGTSYPHELEMRHDPVPPANNKYLKGSTVKLICSGKVGKPAQEWFWYKYNETETIWNLITTDVTKDVPVLVTDCSYFSTAQLEFRIPDDLEHKFRCTAGRSIEYSVNTTINGVVSGGNCQLVSPVLLFCTVLYLIWR